MSPQALYQALLKTPIGESDLLQGLQEHGTHSGFTLVGPAQETEIEKRHRAIGEAQTDFLETQPWAIATRRGKARQDGAFIAYIVFPTTQDALEADKEAASSPLPQVAGVRVVSLRTVPVAGIPSPVTLMNSSRTEPGWGKHGETSLSVRIGNVLVLAGTGAAARTTKGDTRTTLRLARFAVKRLIAIRTQLK